MARKIVSALLLGWTALAAAQGGAPAAAPAAAPGKHAVAPIALQKPLWKDLTPAQQRALEPLSGEWNKLEGLRKQKWLEIANRFASMKPDEQQRVHERMRDWLRLTPEQRRQVRENFARSQKITRARNRPSGSSTSNCRKRRRNSWPTRRPRNRSPIRRRRRKARRRWWRRSSPVLPARQRYRARPA
ncbi:DUF3106 domain-containing protein [Pseudoduganella sp. UC29_71]|uniref:DUF3106 domain-containing protein n=1 Tax=Pseudoduganella sp. UC29_71 TaxID=3350174 RepID=UPI00367134B6